MKREDNRMTKSRRILDLHLIDWEGGVISLETQLKIALRFKCQYWWGGLKSEFEKWRPLDSRVVVDATVSRNEWMNEKSNLK